MLDLAPLNHPCGTLGPDAIARQEVEPQASEPMALRGAEIHAALFETSFAETVAVLPPSLHPSIPAYASLIFYRAPESEIGAFEFAVMGVACRSGIRPRMLTLSAFASTPAAVELLARRWGFPVREAIVRTRFRYDSVRSEIIVGGAQIAEAITLSPELLIGGSRAIRYPQALNHVRRDSLDGLLQCDIAFQYDQSHRGLLTMPCFDADVLTGGRLRPTDLIAGNYARLDAVLLPPKTFLDESEIGKVTKLQVANVPGVA